MADMSTDPQRQSRIAQFRNMAEADPENELGHLSLGRELLAAGQIEESVNSFKRTLELNPNLSKAYELLGEALLGLNRREDAVTVFKRGVTVAAERGDTLPKNAMIRQLEALGEKIPELKEARQIEVGEGQVLDVRTGDVGQRLPRAPFKNRLGQIILENVSATSWREWIGMGTKVINELRLPLSDPKAQQVYEEHMIDFLNLREIVENDPQMKQQAEA